ncbi:MAG: hypothetical protein ACHQK8_01340 [Bacteroidia bacterium]
MKNICLITFAFLISFCSEDRSPKKRQAAELPAVQPPPAVYPKENFEKGKIVPSMNLKSDTTQNFAFYLPTVYSDSAKFPLIIFFDPHGEGTVPLKLYKDLAEKHHYILIASNSSKNGLDANTANRIANNLVNEVMGRFSTDKFKITLCGFSGGAKVALSAGGDIPAVSTIIYCGAAIQFQPSHPVNLLGFAGKRDMNYTDVVVFEQSLKDAPMKHFLVEWNGKHEFPRAEVFKDAFEFLNKGEIENSEKKKVTITRQQLEEEQKLKQKYSEAFQKKDLNWWFNDMLTLRAHKNNLMNERLLGFVSLACYTIVNNALEHNDEKAAEYILQIYKMADPDNPAVKDFENQIAKRRQKK